MQNLSANAAASMPTYSASRQHRRLARDLDGALGAATQPFGYGHLLPRGVLREPPAGLRRADLVVLTHADRLDEGDRTALLNQLRKLTDEAPIAPSRHKPRSLVTLDGGPADAILAEGAPVFCVCSIARPESFETTVRELGYEPVGVQAWPDHHRYTIRDVKAVLDRARASRADAVLTTEKDAVKLARFVVDSPAPVFAVPIAIDFASQDVTMVGLQIDRCIGKVCS